MRARASTTESDAAIAAVVSPLSPARGHVCGRWRLVDELGRGGTAVVWRAVDAAGREAALKIPKPKLEQRGAAAALRHEYAVLTAVANPALVRPLELVDDGVALALEYLPAGDLVPLLGAHARHWLPALRSVAAALRALHGQGLAHGDVKARNVLFAADGSARLIDLTGARACELPAAAATAAYRVPGAATAGEADAFALAALVYELVAGRLPYGETGATQRGAGPAAATAAEAATADLLAAAVAVLRAGGRAPRGLSHLADVIESVHAT